MAKGKSNQGASTPYKDGNDRKGRKDAEKAIDADRQGSMSPDAERAAKEVAKKFGLD